MGPDRSVSSRGMPSDAFVARLNEQIGHEYAAHQQYVACAVHYDAETLPQLARFFYRQALEERDHAMMMVQYLVDADERAVTPGVAAPQVDFANIVAPVALALSQEKRVTEQINGLAALARQEGDYSSEQFMQWFIKEQIEEVATMSDLLRVVERSQDRPMDIEDYLAREQLGEADDGPHRAAPRRRGVSSGAVQAARRSGSELPTGGNRSSSRRLASGRSEVPPRCGRRLARTRGWAPAATSRVVACAASAPSCGCSRRSPATASTRRRVPRGRRPARRRPGVAVPARLARMAVEDPSARTGACRLHRAALRAALAARGRRDLARLAHHAEAADDAGGALELAPARPGRLLGRAHREAAAQYGARAALRRFPCPAAAAAGAVTIRASAVTQRGSKCRPASSCRSRRARCGVHAAR